MQRCVLICLSVSSSSGSQTPEMTFKGFTFFLASSRSNLLSCQDEDAFLLSTGPAIVHPAPSLPWRSPAGFLLRLLSLAVIHGGWSNSSAGGCMKRNRFQLPFSLLLRPCWNRLAEGVQKQQTKPGLALGKRCWAGEGSDRNLQAIHSSSSSLHLT